MKSQNVYQPIHCRSSLSFLRGILTPDEICRQAEEEGAWAVGLADVNGFHGLPAFYEAAERRGLKPVTAMELCSGDSPLLTAFCLDRRGYALLNRLVTAMRRAGAGGAGESFPVLDFFRDEGWEGLVLASGRPDVAGTLQRAVTKSFGSGAGHAGTTASDPFSGPAPLFGALFWGLPFRESARRFREMGLPLLALNAAVFRGDKGSVPGRNDRRLWKLLRAVELNTTVERLPASETPEDYRRFASGAEMGAFFSALPEALENSSRLAEEAGGRLLPKTFVFPGFEGLSEVDAAARLGALCRAGIDRRYGPQVGLRPDIERRLAYELNIIRKKGFAGYFLTVRDIVSRFPRTCGRGSAAASIVSYLLGITHVDPLEYNLFFERFLHEGRKDPPDIDVDFPWDEREEAMAYVFQKYEGHAGLVADHVTFSHRSCVREAARALGFGESDISGMVRAWRLGRGKPLPEYLLRAAAALKGRPRHMGTHPGGVVITPRPLTDYTHTQPGGTGFPVIAWEKDGTEAAGLVKIDLLGNRSLGVLRDSIALVNPLRREEGLPELSWETFSPIDDPDVRTFIESGDTMGIFYVESPATRQLLKKMGRGDYRNLVVASSIIRPAANKWINEFVRRLKGGEFRPPPGPVEEVLRETMGIMVYQEDVARVAMAAAGFSPARADLLRKVMSKKDRELRLPDFKAEFMRGGRRRGISRPELETLWEGILSFQGYSFCKAHSASYALVSYRLAWMKRFHPLPFLASVINNGGGFYSRQVYLNALRRMNFNILPPDINRSDPLYTIEDGALRVGLGQLKNISREFLARLLSSREKEGPFVSYSDFLERLEPRFAEIRVLIRAGALDSVGEGSSRPQLFWLYYHHSPGRFLFDTARPPAIPEYSDTDRLVDEVNLLNLIISRHPLEIFTPRIRRYQQLSGRRILDSRAIPGHAGTRIAVAGTLVAEKETRTKNQKVMSFVSFEDPYSVFETVFFPETWENFGAVLSRGSVFLIAGKVEEEFDVCQIQVEELLSLNREQLSSF